MNINDLLNIIACTKGVDKNSINTDNLYDDEDMDLSELEDLFN